jgi:uncharacterized protein YkwD
MNYLDVIIVGFVILTMYFGYRRGFIKDFASLIALGLALLLASLYYPSIGNLITRWLGMSGGFANSIGFFVIWFLVEFIYYALVIAFYDKIPERFTNSQLNKWAGLLPGALWGFLFVWFMVNLFFLLPISGVLGNQVRDSYIAKSLTKNNVVLGNFLGKTFGPAASDTVGFLTVTPQSSESIKLGYTTTDVTTDTASEKAMFDAVNKERVSRGLSPLVLDINLTKIGEEHCQDMFARGYFSHNTPDGVTPFQRMDKAGIIYLSAGENLALALTESDAMTGLMNSPAHEANILSSDFGKVGIAVIDGGIHGKMFAQEFTN